MEHIRKRNGFTFVWVGMSSDLLGTVAYDFPAHLR